MADKISAPSHRYNRNMLSKLAFGTANSILLAIKARNLSWHATMLGLAIWMSIHPASAQEPVAGPEPDLAKKLSNPIAALVSIPFKMDYDGSIGSANAGRETYVVQPVIPVTLDDDWNVISRTILPYVDAQSPKWGGRGASGMADTLQSLFFSPKKPTDSGWIWGAGPVLSAPTGTSAFGSEKWSLGPTVVLLRQKNGWTYGVLANQLWSIGGNSSRANISAAFVQPFLSYTTNSSTTYGMNLETGENWQASQLTVPVNVTVSQLVNLGGRPISFLLGGRVYAQRPSGGSDWGLRFQITLLLPK